MVGPRNERTGTKRSLRHFQEVVFQKSDYITQRLHVLHSERSGVHKNLEIRSLRGTSKPHTLIHLASSVVLALAVTDPPDDDQAMLSGKLTICSAEIWALVSDNTFSNAIS